MFDIVDKYRIGMNADVLKSKNSFYFFLIIELYAEPISAGHVSRITDLIAPIRRLMRIPGPALKVKREPIRDPVGDQQKMLQTADLSVIVLQVPLLDRMRLPAQMPLIFHRHLCAVAGSGITWADQTD